MKIVCDRNMTFGTEAFATLGDVTAKDGRDITAEDVRDADLLFTRSTTKVNAALLEGSRVRFYGSAVIGTDHIDIPYLNGKGIAWTGAPGCNAESVATYFAAALLKLGIPLEGRTVGIVGVGNVGKRVVLKAQAFGMRVLCCDPPRQEDPADAAAQGFVSLETVLREADIITLHVPLTKEGPHKTFHLLDAAAFAQMKKGVVLINAARGPVLVTDTLLAAMDNGTVSAAVIDCWEGEPVYRTDLLHRANIATPHIAGHSFEGKVNGTKMVYERACTFLGIEPVYRFELPPAEKPVVEIVVAGRTDEDVLREIVPQVYDIVGDDRRLRESCTEDTVVRAKTFDYQRGHYPMRRQFEAVTVKATGASEKLLRKIAALGFRIA